METRQLEHEGFEHVDEFRVPQEREWYQSNSGMRHRCDHLGETGSLEHGGKRWILRKKTEEECTCKVHPHRIYCNCTNAFTTTNERPAQKCFAGFEHTGQYRHPCHSEWYQSFTGCVAQEGVDSDCYKDEPRWILRKIQEKAGNPPQQVGIKGIDEQLRWMYDNTYDLSRHFATSIERLRNEILKLKENK